MRKLKWILIVANLFCTIINSAYGQGCSDAGICTMDSFKPHEADSILQESNQIKVGTFYGNADHSIAVYGMYLEYNRLLNNKFGLDVKLNTLAQNGNNINTFGLSDVFFKQQLQSK